MHVIFHCKFALFPSGSLNKSCWLLCWLLLCTTWSILGQPTTSTCSLAPNWLSCTMTARCWRTITSTTLTSISHKRAWTSLRTFHKKIIGVCVCVCARATSGDIGRCSVCFLQKCAHPSDQHGSCHWYVLPLWAGPGTEDRSQPPRGQVKLSFLQLLSMCG